MAHKKVNLQQKTCTICAKPFAWRKKWQRCWDDVKYCSERCRRHKQASKKLQLNTKNTHA